jgi:simple sugar transport system ATP-binding protein
MLELPTSGCEHPEACLGDLLLLETREEGVMTQTSTTQNRTPVVEMQGIHKAFGAVQALQDVDLRLYPGEILGLVGDNSAGKSTLMKILTGAYIADTGVISVEGQPVHFSSPQDSRRKGIEMVYQDFALCGNLDIATNIFLGRWPTTFGGLFVDKRRMERESWDILQRLKIAAASVNLKVESLSGGRQQSVAIARAVSFGPKVVVLDEPTANLSASVTDQVLNLMRELKSHGVAQIIISHRLTDILAEGVGDRIMVLKRGQNVGERLVKDTNEDEILGMMIQGEPVKKDQQAA